MPDPPCECGRAHVRAILGAAEQTIAGDAAAGRHGWLLRSLPTLVELCRQGCASAADIDDARDMFDRIKPGNQQSPREWSDALAWAIANSDGAPECREHGGIDASVLIRERTPLQELHDQLRYWIDGDLGQFTFAAAVATSAADTIGEPVWGQIVGAPSSGKTEPIRCTDSIATAKMDGITVAGLLGWQKVGKTSRMTGALADIGNEPKAALLTIGDFSTLLSDQSRRSGNDADTVFKALRRIFDGYYNRQHGQAPEKLEWHGRITILSAVTHAIDDYSAYATALGDRWIYYRVPEIKTRRPSRGRDPRLLATRRRRAAELMATAIHKARRRLPDIELSGDALDRLDEAADFVAIGRGSVPRDSYGKREVIGEPVIEEPYRIRQQLQTLARALVALEMPEEGAVAFATRCGLDTLPRTRTKLLGALNAQGGLSTKQAAADAGGVHRLVARRVLGDLRLLGLVDCPALDRSEVDSEEVAPGTTLRWELVDHAFPEVIRRILPGRVG